GGVARAVRTCPRYVPRGRRGSRDGQRARAVDARAERRGRARHRLVRRGTEPACMTRARLLSAFDFTACRDWVAAFRRFDVPAFERQLRTRPEQFWRDLGAARALRLFTLASRRVPAYRAFLEQYRVHPARIRTADHLADVPPTDKTNYIKAYPLAARCWDGRLNGARLIAMSSGT